MMLLWHLKITTFCDSVAVIQNQVPFVYNDFVSPINLGSAQIGGGQNALVAGWGGTGPGIRTYVILLWTHNLLFYILPEGPPWPNTLQVLNVTTLTNIDCRARHTAENAYFIFDQKICAYYSHAGVCFGNLILSC